MFARFKNRFKNLRETKFKWSFVSDPLILNRKVLRKDETIYLKQKVKNNGFSTGTAYVRVCIAKTYELDNILFDSHRDLSQNNKQALRLTDIPRGKSKEFTVSFMIPSGWENKNFEVRLQIWNPHLLFGGPNSFCFYDSGWHGGFEIVSNENLDFLKSVFISYSWDNDAHKIWVKELAEELAKYNLNVIIDQTALLGGDETTLFMERSILMSCAILLVCTENYTEKANNRTAGGVGYETVLGSNEYMLCTPEQRSKFIPIVRNNNRSRKLPSYLGSALYLDMNGEDWRSQPLQDLINSIRRHL